jgi:hypothetical protein
MKRNRMNFWQNSRTFPPILVRLLAKSGKLPMTTQEIAHASKLSAAKVEAISMSLTWDDIDIPSAFAFMTACHMDFCKKSDMHRARDYIRSARWVYLRRSRQWKTYYEPMMRRYFESVDH